MSHLVSVDELAEELADIGFGQPVVATPAGWHAWCSCGWQGNNPHLDEYGARESAAYHEATAE